MTSNDRDHRNDPDRPNAPYLARGPRIGIRPFTAADRDEFTARARESTELHRPWLAPPATDADYASYLARLQEPLREGFLFCELDSGKIAGYLTINNIVHGAFRSGAIGYGAFAHAAGRGLMSEGLRLVLRHAFEVLGLHRLEVNIQPANAASLALVQRAGFRREGYSPDLLFIDGGWRDHERWALTHDAVQRPVFGRSVPVFRIFDLAKAREFYVDYLGCTVDWEHCFEPGTPRYLQVSRGALVLHLSEHHGDATPGSTLFTELTGVRELHAELAAKDYPYLRPGLEEDETGRSLTLIDPFGNRLRFNEPPTAGA